MYQVGLLTIIRDFFVHFVFGGLDSTGRDFGTPLWISGALVYPGETMQSDSEYISAGITNTGVASNMFDFGNWGTFEYVNLADWLSSTATIITLCLLLFAVFLAIKFLFKLVAGSFLKIGE